MSSPKFLKVAGRTFAPSCFVSVVPDIIEVPHKRYHDRVIHKLRSLHVVESHRKEKLWTEPLYQRFDKGFQLFDWLERWGSEKRRTQVVCPIASNVLTLAGFWDRITEAGCILTRRPDPDAPNPSQDSGHELGQDRPQGGELIDSSSAKYDPTIYQFSGLVINGKPDIVKYRVFGRGIVWTSAAQYFSASEDSIAKAIGYRWPVSSAASDRGDATPREPGERAFFWLRAFQHLADWWKEIDGGPWGLTVGQMSMSFLRKRIKPKSILIHKNRNVAALEESGLFGGRASVWYVGNIGKQSGWEQHKNIFPPQSQYGWTEEGACHIDIRSMYPWVLANMPFPTRLSSYRWDYTVDSIRELLTDFGVIARVRIKTPEPEFPLRLDDRVIYPVGEFVTTLCGPELQAAINSGYVLKVYEAADYVMSESFRPAALELLKHRMDSKQHDSPGFELFVKHLSNAMGGKLAQRKFQWKERPDKGAERDWGIWSERDADSKSSRVFRAIAGLVWEKIESESPIRPLAACFAYLTAYGRFLMTTLRRLCPARTVYSQDTDGLWVSRDAVEYLPIGDLGSEYAPGDLRVTTECHYARFFSPIHYWTDKGWVLSGFADPKVDLASLEIKSRETNNPIYGAPAAPPRQIYTAYQSKHINKIMTTDPIDFTGWVHPPRVYQPPF